MVLDISPQNFPMIVDKVGHIDKFGRGCTVRHMLLDNSPWNDADIAFSSQVLVFLQIDVPFRGCVKEAGFVG